MASTSGRRQRKSTSKKASKKVAKTVNKRAEKKLEVPTHLTPEDFMSVEMGQRDVENARLRVGLEEQQLQNLTLSHKNLLHQLKEIEFKIESQKRIVESKDLAHKKAQIKYTKLKEEIWPKYGLKITDPMAYDPETREIVKG